MGYAPSVYSSEALLHYASPNWLADMMLCLGVASPPLSIKGATQRHYDIQNYYTSSLLNTARSVIWWDTSINAIREPGLRK